MEMFPQLKGRRMEGGDRIRSRKNEDRRKEEGCKQKGRKNEGRRRGNTVGTFVVRFTTIHRSKHV